MRKFIRGLTVLVGCGVTVLWGLMVHYQSSMPEQFSVTEGKQLQLDGVVQVVERPVFQTIQPTAGVRDDTTQKSTLSLFGVFPIKTVTVKEVTAPVVVVCGMPFGIKMYTDGVLIVGFSDVDAAAGLCNPARIAGLKVGDVVLSVNGQPVSTNNEIRQLIEGSEGEKMTFVVRRDNLRFEVEFKAVRSVNENRYKSGFWVRDSSAGIGTLTFFDPDTQVFGGLGHAVCDVDTDEPLPISTGEIVGAEILDVEKGKSGAAGSLNGVVEDQTIGYLSINAETGVYGKLARFPTADFQTVPVAMKQQVKTGTAEIISTVSGDTPKRYEVEIIQIRYNDSSPTKNMIVKITDPELLDKTGGIVQGMSGSPIIQNGKLVGAVTHVLLDDPTRGYAIFAENMLATAESVTEESLKTAS